MNAIRCQFSLNNGPDHLLGRRAPSETRQTDNNNVFKKFHESRPEPKLHSNTRRSEAWEPAPPLSPNNVSHLQFEFRAADIGAPFKAIVMLAFLFIFSPFPRLSRHQSIVAHLHVILGRWRAGERDAHAPRGGQKGASKDMNEFPEQRPQCLPPRRPVSKLTVHKKGNIYIIQQPGAE